MTELYRAILSIINENLSKLMDELRTQVRKYNDTTTKQGTEFDFGTIGFWNFMLEVVLNFYTIFCKFTGVFLVGILAVVFYPLTAVLTMIHRSFRGILAEPSNENKK